MRSPVVVALAAVSVAACSTKRTEFPADLPGVRIATAAFAAEYSIKTAPLAIPFELDPTGTSGTELAIGYLRRAEAYGARYVSDLAIAVHFEHDDVAIECVSTIVVEMPAATTGIAAAAAIAPVDDDVYATQVKPWQPDTVTATVDDRDLVCKKVGNQVIAWEPLYSSRTGAEVKGYIPHGEMPMVRNARIVYSDECHLETTRREVTRYAHFVATRVTPLDLARIGAEFSDYTLSESPPVCRELRAGEAAHHRIMGNLHFIGSYGRTELPDVMAR